MHNVRLDIYTKRDAQIFLENSQSAKSEDVDKLINSYKLGSEGAWIRFTRGAYNHPITWWIGLLQIQMQLGVWGHARKAQAQIVAHQLSQTLKVMEENSNKKILYKALTFNLKYRKSDILGRFVGGAFTNYASAGGSIGSRNISKSSSRVVSVSNFVMASYGASIKAVATGHNKIEHVIQSVLTGAPYGPAPYPDVDDYELSNNEVSIFNNANQALAEINSLTDLSPHPVPIAEFCLRPENINLKGICK